MPQISTKQSRFLVLATLLFLFPASVVAIPIADYHENLKKAITALDTLSQSDEDESPDDYESRFERTIEGVRAALPEHQTVESPEGVCEIDNSWLHRDLKEVMAAVDPSKKLNQVIQRLHAIEARIAERVEQAPPAERKGWAKSRLESILARPEYKTGERGPNAFTRLLRDFLRWLQKLFPKPGPMQSGRANIVSLIAQILVVLFAVFVLVYVVKLL